MNYLIGDATDPVGKPTVIAHVCNVQGGWGKGFVLALSNRWAKPEKSYRNIKDYQLGTIQVLQVEEDLWVSNMMAQNGYISRSNPVPLDMDALETCLIKLNKWCEERDLSITMPKIGAGLGGGNWDEIESLINTVVTVPVTVYTLE